MEDGRARLTVAGELDLATVPRLEAEVRAVLAKEAREVLIDLGAVTFVDSSGLNLLITLNDRAALEGWSLRLTRPSAGALSVFRISGADENLPFLDVPPSR